MGILLTYLIVCGAAWYFGGPDLAGVAFIIITILWALSASSNTQHETSLADRERHRQDGDGHIYYQRDGQMIHESDGCAACMANRAAELTRQGYSVEHIPGRRNSGEL
jgi:hypothetical protein